LLPAVSGPQIPSQAAVPAGIKASSSWNTITESTREIGLLYLDSTSIFRIGLPLPDALPNGNGNVALIRLISDASIYSNAEPTFEVLWRGGAAELDLTRRLAIERSRSLDSEGLVFALVFESYSNMTSRAELAIQAQEFRLLSNTIPLTVTCASGFGLTPSCECPVGANCDLRLLSSINDSVDNVKNNYVKFSQIYTSTPRLEKLRFVPVSNKDCVANGQPIAGAYTVLRRVL
jgi:hypothetical protein